MYTYSSKSNNIHNITTAFTSLEIENGNAVHFSIKVNDSICTMILNIPSFMSPERLAGRDHSVQSTKLRVDEFKVATTD